MFCRKLTLAFDAKVLNCKLIVLFACPDLSQEKLVPPHVWSASHWSTFIIPAINFPDFITWANEPLKLLYTQQNIFSPRKTLIGHYIMVWKTFLAWISANKMKVAHYCTWLVYDFKKKESGNMVWIYHIGAGRLCLTLSCVTAKELQLRTGQKKIINSVFLPPCRMAQSMSLNLLGKKEKRESKD